VTLGCSKNLVDSEVLLTQLRGNDIQTTHQDSKTKSNVVIINTCGFIDNAKQESIDTILQYAKAKEQGEIEKLYVTGCLSQRYRDDLEKEIPGVDAFFGTMELPQLLKKFNADYKHELLGERITSTSRHYAYLKISEGCNHRCTFCIIPSMRGDLVSRPIGDVLQEAENLVNAGVKELLVISQDTSAYGVDIRHATSPWRGEEWRAHITDLARGLGSLGAWLRLHYIYPYPHVDHLIPLMAEGLVLPYLDIPFQHAAPNVLRAMRRPANEAKVLERIAGWRAVCPEITLRSTFIVGFPGETERDFAATLDLVAVVGFAQAYSFKYSPRPGTPAALQAAQVAEPLKSERLARLQALLDADQARFNAAHLGRELPVLLERQGRHPGQLVGRSPYNQAVHVTAPAALMGTVQPVVIAECHANSLAGRLAVAATPGNTAEVALAEGAMRP